MNWPPVTCHWPRSIRRADAGEEVGAEALDLRVEPGLAAGEDEVGVFVAAVGHGGGGGQRLVGAGLPGPEPHRVDVGVGDHVDEQRNAKSPPFWHLRTTGANSDLLT